MKKQRLLTFGMLLLVSTVTFTPIHAITEEEIREQAKDRFIECQAKQIELAKAIQAERNRVATRSCKELISEACEYGLKYPLTASHTASQIAAETKIYMGSVALRNVMESFDRQDRACQQIQREIPSKKQSDNETIIGNDDTADGNNDSLN